MRWRWSARGAAERHGAMLWEKGAEEAGGGSEGSLRREEGERRGCTRRGVEMGGGRCAESSGSCRRGQGGASELGVDCGGTVTLKG